ncbi:C25 family cysteine peptidase [Desulfovibrio sp. JC022]|uniref:C25 family cysteine peptidase n=1 Tax=Desulfovibrio sp. JC022 TaxID=2593642 RepID=UPI0013D3FDAE|nr:C25 family cysteine peptidase [Desulfovibrio sp. JC022]NDV22247.1 sporulation protein [Desulfovibrio sp. JC022]
MVKLKKILIPLLVLACMVLLSGCKVKGFGKTAAPVAAPVLAPVKVSSAPYTEEKKSVIVCTADFLRAARSFSYLHREYEGVKSVILKVPSCNGTAESVEKVVSGVRGQVDRLNKNGKVMSVLILGNRDIIPTAGFSVANGTEVFLSDYGYGGSASAPENMLPVGRIPARDCAEAEAVAAKYERWYGDREFRPAWPVSFIGGEGFSARSLSDSELLFFNLQQEGIAGPEAIRYLGAAGGATPQRLQQSLAEDDVSVQWLALEARSEGFKAGSGIVSVPEILSLEYKPGLPVILNPSCEVVALNSTMPTPAEAVVLSSGGGLAMMTGCNSAGNIRAELDDGRVFRVDSSGTPRLLMEFHKAYFSGKHRMGDALIEARAQFAQNLLEGESLAPLYDLVFYGDPVMSLPLPVRTESPSYKGLNVVTKSKKQQGVAVFAVNSTISFAMEEGGVYPAVRLQVIDRSSGKVVSSMKVEEDDIFNFMSDGEGQYLIYSRPLDGPLAWQFFDVREKGKVDKNESAVVVKRSRPSPRISAGLKPVNYAVQVSSNRKEKSAVKVRQRLSGQGYEAYVVEIPSANNRKWYCVRFGRFDSWADAVEASAAYERKEQADAKIVRCNGG